MGGGAVVPAPVTVRVKFGGEAEHTAVTVPSPASPASVCAAVLAARADVRKMLADTYVGFELALCDPESGRPMDPATAGPIAPDAQLEITLTKAYAVRAFAPVRKYVVGRFLGTKPPKFKAGKAAGVDWQLCREKSAFGGAHPTLKLTNGGKQRAVFNGIREGGALSNFYLLMMQANTTDVCAIPMEQWYNFRPTAPRKVLTLEEAEERMESRARNVNTTGTRIDALSRAEDEDDGLSDGDAGSDLRAGDSDDDDDDNDYDSKAKRRKKRAKKEEEESDVKAASGDAPEEAAPGARGMTKAEGDDWEHDEGASDDEGAGEADELELEEPPPPPPPTAGFADSDDEGVDAEGDELGEEGKKLRRLVGRQEDEEGGGISDDSDDDDEFVDPDQEELHPFLLQQRDKMQAQATAAAATAQRQATEEVERRREMERRRAQIGLAANAPGAATKSEPVAAGTKRSRSEDFDAPPGAKAAKMGRASSHSDVKPEPGAESDARPIEAALRDMLRRGKHTTKDVTKALRKRGLLNTDADKSELKETISRIARIRKEGNVGYVVLL